MVKSRVEPQIGIKNFYNTYSISTVNANMFNFISVLYMYGYNLTMSLTNEFIHIDSIKNQRIY